MDRYKSLWSGRFGKINVTPHRATYYPGTRPIRSQTYLKGFHYHRPLADKVSKKLQVGVIDPSQSAWSFLVVIVHQPDRSRRFCV